MIFVRYALAFWISLLTLFSYAAQVEKAPVALTGKANVAQARKANITVLATGGTIAGTGATSTTTVGYTDSILGVDQLLNSVPKIQDLATVRGEQILQIASENMTDAHWLKLGKRVNELVLRSDVDGIVITHGTDTLEETAYFLNLTVKTRKPIVLVGAMRPATAISADGPMNLTNAIALAASPEARGQGVLVALNDEIHAARGVTKANTVRLDAFQTPDFGPLGRMESLHPYFARATTRRHTVETEFDVSSKVTQLPKVDIVYGYAGMDPVQIDALVKAGSKGIVIAGTGNGSIPTLVLPRLLAARKSGVIIIRSSRVGGGPVSRNGEVNDDALDFVAGDNLNPQQARILLIVALTNPKFSDTKKIQELFLIY